MLLRLVYPTSLVLLSCWQMRRGLWTPDFLNMSSAAKREMVFHERVKCLNICYVFCVLLWKEYWFTQHSSMFYVSVVNLFPGSSFQTSGGSFVGFQLLSSEKISQSESLWSFSVQEHVVCMEHFVVDRLQTDSGMWISLWRVFPHVSPGAPASCQSWQQPPVFLPVCSNSAHVALFKLNRPSSKFKCSFH